MAKKGIIFLAITVFAQHVFSLTGEFLSTPDSGKCAAKDKGFGCEAESEGSRRQMSVLMHRNLISRQFRMGKVAFPSHC